MAVGQEILRVLESDLGGKRTQAKAETAASLQVQLNLCAGFFWRSFTESWGAALASVFLSYAREDADKARLIALALEKVGHSVWWDSHIEGGAEFGHEIEQALENSDAVVVLWSKSSVASAWVRDEAAAGQDRGRLVPIRLDDSNPPMGFRQLQNVELIGWNGRGKVPRLDNICAGIDRVAHRGSVVAPTVAASKYSGALPSFKIHPALIAVLVIAAVGALFAWRSWNASTLPFVSVEPADQSGSAKSLADDLFIKLGSLQTAEAGALQLVEPDANVEPDFTFKVQTEAATGALQANLALVDSDGALLWSREFTQPSGNAGELRQQIAYTAGQVLRCATEALAPDHPKLDPSLLSLYLKGCADLSATPDTRMAISTFRIITQKAPRFAGGWGKLLIAEMEALKATGASDLALKNELGRDAAEARKVDPDLAEIYLVQSWLQKPRPILRWMRFADEALRKKPNNAAILENHAIGLGHVGRMREAVEDARLASEVEPLSPSARQTLIAFLGDLGDFRAAERELEQAERLWPGARSIRQARFWFEYRYGDPSNALGLIKNGDLGLTATTEQMSFLRARIDRSPASIALAVDEAQKAYERDGAPTQLVQTLGTFGRADEAIEVLLSADPKIAHGIISVFFRRPALRDVRRDPRFMKVAQRYGLIDYWQATGRWPDFCEETDLPYNCKQEAAKLRS